LSFIFHHAPISSFINSSKGFSIDWLGVEALELSPNIIFCYFKERIGNKAALASLEVYDLMMLLDMDKCLICSFSFSFTSASITSQQYSCLCQIHGGGITVC
jgi:hypothetical protein